MKFHFPLFIALTVASSMPITAVEQASTERLNEVERLGRHVMPFDLNKTLHVFSKTEDGGIQQVISKKPLNKSQIILTQEHLKKIAAEFKQGNFTDPTKIHGKDMPGLNALKNAKPGSIIIKYRELENGAEITYATKTPELITAIHQWFDAQLSDHARHSTKDHSQHMMHNQ
ncbi:MAG: aspartate carbamoyltransferase [Methylococcales bacterium]|nr:aspartate carbamoyltransferase [Methylococcales bacterium]